MMADMNIVKRTGHSLPEAKVSMTLSFSSVEDCGEAVEAVKAAARVLHPGILFPGEPGFDDAPDGQADQGRCGPAATPAAGAAAPSSPAPARKRGPLKSSWPLKAGTVDARAFAAIARLGTADTVAVADELDMKTNIAGCVLARLRAAGLIEKALAEHGGSVEP